jgi:hypothetical protein
VSDNLCVCCETRPTPDGYACSGCCNRAGDKLALIAGLAPDARLVAAGLVRRGGGSGSNKPGSRPPLNDGATDTLDEVQNTLTTLARDIADTRGQSAPRHLGRDPIVVAARALQAQIEWMRHALDGAEPYAIRAFDEIADCAGRLRGVVNGPGEQKFLGPCGSVLAATATPCPGECSCRPDTPTAKLAACTACFCFTGCHAKVATDAEGQICVGDVYGYHGAKTGRCKACGAEVATSEREAWLNGEVREHAFEARDIAEAHRLNVKTIRTWANRGALRTYWRTSADLVIEWTDPPLDDALKGEDRAAREAAIADELAARGPRLHYVGDVLDLAAADAARRATEQAKRARRTAIKAEDERLSA